jgi:hypothetical protein
MYLLLRGSRVQGDSAVGVMQRDTIRHTNHSSKSKRFSTEQRHPHQLPLESPVNPKPSISIPAFPDLNTTPTHLRLRALTTAKTTPTPALTPQPNIPDLKPRLNAKTKALSASCGSLRGSRADLQTRVLVWFVTVVRTVVGGFVVSWEWRYEREASERVRRICAALK